MSSDPISDDELTMLIAGSMFSASIRPESNAAPMVLRALQELLERRAAEVHCNICGGTVDLTNATAPTAHAGRGQKQ